MQPSRLLVQIALFNQMNNVTGYVLLAVVRGPGQVVCGFMLGRWLYAINRWHVLAALAAVDAVLVLVATPWVGLSELAAVSGMSVSTLIAGQIIGPSGVLAFVATGIWFGRKLVFPPRQSSDGGC
jgi:hypothetical protein